MFFSPSFFCNRQSAVIAAAEKKISPAPMNTAQFIKNCSGITVIISSVYGLNIQLSLPGKSTA